MIDLPNILLEELKYLKEKGVKDVYISDASLNVLFSKKIEERKTPLAFSPNNTSNTVTINVTDTKQNNSIPVVKIKNSTIETLPPKIVLPSGSKQKQITYLRDLVLGCQECKKHINPGKKIVFGTGKLDADIFFCGEAPGAEEEEQGLPFVGKAGQLLTKMIGSMGLSRDDVYIGNIMNWRPQTGLESGNRPPTQEEMQFCLPYLKAQIAVVKPKVIVALGATAVSGLLGQDPKRRMGDIRGKWHNFEDVPLMITFHPSYLLRNNTNATKRIVWEDLLAVMEKVHLPISEKQKNYFL